LAAFAAHIFQAGAVAFNAPGDILAINRLGINANDAVIYQYGIDSDSIFMGKCDVSSPSSTSMATFNGSRG
jgi:putative lipase involved disintegration of autophagic bodies